MKTIANICRFILRLGTYALGLVLVLVAALIGLAGFTSFGGDLVAGIGARLASTPGRIVTLTDVGPLFTGHLRIGAVTVADAKGEYATARDVVLDWSPTALLDRRFKAELLSASSLTLSRLPESEPSQIADDTNGGFSLPVTVEIDRLALPELLLGKAVARRDLVLALDGSAALDNRSIRATLAAHRTDVEGLALETRLTFAPQDNALELKLALSEPAGGMIAGLLGLPGEPALAVDLDGTGPLIDWQGKLKAALDGTQVLDVDAQHQMMTGEVRRIAVKGAGRLDTLAPPDLRNLLAGRTAIDMAVQLAPTGAITVERGALSNDSLALAAQGRYDPQGDNDLTARITPVAGAVPFRWPLGDGALDLKLTGLDLSIAGPAQAARVKADIAAESLQLPQAALGDVKINAESPAFNLASRSGSLTAQIDVSAARFTDPEVERAVKAPLKIVLPATLSASAIAFDKATIESASIGGTISGNYRFGDGGAEADFNLFALPAVAPPSIAEKLDGTIRLSGKAAYARPSQIALSDLSLETNILNVTGRVTLADESVDADLAARLPDIGTFIANARGAATATVRASGPLSAPELSGRIASDRAELTGRALQGLSIAFDGTADPKAPSGRVSASGTLDDGLVRAEATLRQEDGVTVLPQLSLTVGTNSLTGSGKLDAAFRPEGAVTFDFPDLALLGALAGQQIAGDLKGRVEAESRAGRTALQVEATGSRMTRDALAIDAPNISLAVSDVAALAAEGRITAQSVASGTHRVASPVLNLARQDGRTRFDLAARYDEAPLVVKGSLSEEGGAQRIDLTELAATPRGIALTLDAPATIRIVDGGAQIGQLAIRAGTGTVTATGRVGDTLAATVAIADLPASLANTFASNLGAEGRLSGQITASGSLDAPRADFRLALANASIAQIRSAGLPAIDITARGGLADNRVQVELSASGPAALAINGGGSVTLTGTQPLDLKFQGSFPVSLLATQLAAQGFTAEGSLSANAMIGGTLGSPAISATASGNSLRLVDVRRNLALEGLQVQAALENDRVTISGLRGRLSTGGAISGGGTIDLKGQGLPADIAVRLEKAVYVQGNLANTVADGNLALKGPLLGNAALSGTVDLGKTAVTVPERLPPSLAEINVTHRNAPAAVKAQLAEVTTKDEGNGSGSAIGLDLRVNANSQIFVRGRGIDAELGGALTIRGTSAEPSVSGAFTLRRGRLSILNKRLEFTSGTITFGGGLVPILNLVATTSSGSTTITITVAGPANDPEITFTSAPSLPQDEVLAQLIFGQSISKLSPLQIAQLADSVSQLAGGRSTSLFQTLRGGIGIDDLDVGTDDQGRARVTAGKYLNDRTYLELQQDADTGGKAIINLDVGRGLKLRGEAGGNGSSGAGIFYEKEY